MCGSAECSPRKEADGLRIAETFTDRYALAAAVSEQFPPMADYLMLRVVLPPATGERARAAYRAFEKELHFNPRQALEA